MADDPKTGLPRLRVARVHYPVTALGPGQRLGVWVQGCGLACPGCMSRDTWDAARGRLVTIARLAETWHAAASAGAAGVTLSGGEPLDQAAAVAAFLRQVRQDTAADVLVYTGYEWQYAWRKASGVLRLADAVITGPYEASRPTDLIWRGSAGQQLVPLTELGRQRYERYVDFETSRPPIQVGSDADGYWIVGVPRTGDLPRMERLLRDRGILLSDVSWRPASASRVPSAESNGDARRSR
jgi:anaerobic ribonucleoside-triphosphate reductase activating protein